MAMTVRATLMLRKCVFRQVCSIHHSGYGRKTNIILMGSPGSGKTTVGKLLGRKLNKSVIDIDDHHLERHWGMPVSQKLGTVGPDNFIEEEGQALLQFHAENSVISLTGSNPMHQAGMTKMATTGVVVFLDVQQEDILKRLEKMKVNRIVGQGGGSSMADILKFRQQFYNKYYDIRIICYEHEPPESVADKVCQALTQLADSHTYVSTQSSRHDDVNKGFNDVVLEGLAADGGLYVPAGGIPRLSLQDWSRLIPLSYPERALLILEKWIHPWQLQPSRLRQMVYEAYRDNFQSTYICPVYDLGDDCYMSELFHGPTASFKDAALQLMPCFFQHAIDEIRETDRYLVLVATSGDTGGAVLDGFARQTIQKIKIRKILIRNEL